MPDEPHRDDVANSKEQDSVVESPSNVPRNQHLKTEPSEYKSTREEERTIQLERDIKSGERWLIGIGIATLLVNTVIAFIYWNQLREMRKATKAATDAVTIAQDTLGLARSNFRKDERPYVTLAPAGSVATMVLLGEGEHAGHLQVKLQLANYGKSPAIEIMRDAHIAIGPEQARHIRLNRGVKVDRIIPPNDKPDLIVYSDQIINEEMRKGFLHRLVIIYGHVEYTDLLGEPSPIYISEFCTAITQEHEHDGQANDACQGHRYIK